MQKIVIIEDNSTIRGELALLLSNEGYQTVTVTEFTNVAMQVLECNPNLILLDLNLPERDGLSLCADIRKASTIPIIFVTSRDSAVDELRALSLGGDVFQDPERWAEFIVFLKGSQQSGVNDLNVIDAEVCKVKEGSSKPAYGSETGAVIEIGSEFITGHSHYPRCNEIVRGVWPHIASIGHLLKSEAEAQGGDDAGEVEFPKVGTIAASEECYQPYDYVRWLNLDSGVDMC